MAEGRRVRGNIHDIYIYRLTMGNLEFVVSLGVGRDLIKVRGPAVARLGARLGIL
jgi:hypothetical protein